MKFADGTVWLSQKMMGKLFDVHIATINEHLKNIYENHELDKKATIRNFLIVQKEGNRDVKRNIEFYKRLKLRMLSIDCGLIILIFFPMLSTKRECFYGMWTILSFLALF